VPFSSIHVASARSDVLSARLAEVEFICEVAYPKATIGERLVVADMSRRRPRVAGVNYAGRPAKLIVATHYGQAAGRIMVRRLRFL